MAKDAGYISYPGLPGQIKTGCMASPLNLVSVSSILYDAVPQLQSSMKVNRNHLG